MFLFPFFNALHRIGKAVDGPREIDNIKVMQCLEFTHFQKFCYTMRHEPQMETIRCSNVGKQKKYSTCFHAEEASI